MPEGYVLHTNSSDLNLIVWFCRESETVAVLQYKYTRYNTSEMVGREDVQGSDAGPKPENLSSQPKEKTFSGVVQALHIVKGGMLGTVVAARTRAVSEGSGL